MLWRKLTKQNAQQKHKKRLSHINMLLKRSNLKGRDTQKEKGGRTLNACRQDEDGRWRKEKHF